MKRSHFYYTLAFVSAQAGVWIVVGVALDSDLCRTVGCLTFGWTLGVLSMLRLVRSVARGERRDVHGVLR